MDDTRELIWYAEGSQVAATQPLAAGTYYAEVASMPGRGHCHEFDWDAALAAVITFQCGLKGTGHVSTADARRWSTNAAYGSVTIVAGAVGSDTVPIVDGEATRTRAKAVVTAQGELLGRTR